MTRGFCLGKVINIAAITMVLTVMFGFITLAAFINGLEDPAFILW